MKYPKKYRRAEIRTSRKRLKNMKTLYNECKEFQKSRRLSVISLDSAHVILSIGSIIDGLPRIIRHEKNSLRKLQRLLKK